MGKLRERQATIIFANLILWRRVGDRYIIGTITGSKDTRVLPNRLRTTFECESFEYFPAFMSEWEDHILCKHVTGRYFKANMSNQERIIEAKKGPLL